MTRLAPWVFLLAIACDGKAQDDDDDDGGSADGGGLDGGTADGGAADGGGDGGTGDGGTGDGGTTDGGTSDGGTGDGGTGDGGGTDGGSTDGGSTDGGSTDGGGADGGGTSDGGSSDGGSSDGGTGDGGTGDGGSGDGGGLDWDPSGRVYLADLSAATWVEPYGLGSLFGSFFTAPLLIGVTELSTELELRTGWSLEDRVQQDLCVPTSEAIAAIDTLPAWETEAFDIDLVIAEVTTPVGEVVLAARFGDEGDPLSDGTLVAVADMRKWVPFFEATLGTSDPDDACDLLSGFGVDCAACSTDGEAYCLPMEAHDITAEEVDLSLERRTGGEIAKDPDCR